MSRRLSLYATRVSPLSSDTARIPMSARWRSDPPIAMTESARTPRGAAFAPAMAGVLSASASPIATRRRKPGRVKETRPGLASASCHLLKRDADSDLLVVVEELTHGRPSPVDMERRVAELEADAGAVAEAVEVVVHPVLCIERELSGVASSQCQPLAQMELGAEPVFIGRVVVGLHGSENGQRPAFLE